MLFRVSITSTLILGVASKKVNVHVVPATNPNFEFLGSHYVEQRGWNVFRYSPLDRVVLQLRLLQPGFDYFAYVVIHFAELYSSRAASGS